MAGAATRAGLLATVAAAFAAGGIADATEEPPMTKTEAKGFKKEITAKLKAYETRIREIQAEEKRRYEDEVGVIDSEAALQASMEVAADADRARATAGQEFLDAVRACVDDANVDEAHRAEANAGSVVANAVAKANATLAKESLQTDATLQKMQAEARKECNPAAILRSPGTLGFRHLPAGALRDAAGAEPAPRVFISYGYLSGNGNLGVVVSSNCDAPHDHQPVCLTPGIKVEIRDSVGTHEITGEAVDGVLEVTDLVTWTTSPQAIVTVSNTTGATTTTDTACFSSAATPPEEPPLCIVATGTFVDDGVGQDVDGLGNAVRILLEEGVSWFCNFSDYDPEDAGQLSCGMFFPDGSPTSGELVITAITGSPPQGAIYARVTYEGVEIPGTVTLLEVDAVVNPATTAQFRCRFESQDGKKEATFCIPPEDIGTSD
jgi:hypothetical protein